MSAVLRVLGRTVAARWRQLLGWGFGFAVASQLVLMAALLLRFRDWPNYVTFYDWPGNVWRIVQSTPAWSDVWPIVWEEWLIEIGYMNYDYGMGISEWSLNVVPSRLLMFFGLGILVGLATSLMRSESCSTATLRSSGVATGMAALMVAMTNATMSWVVCCATPSWVVGLAMLGLGVSTSLALETLGPLIAGAGFGLLLLMILYLAWRRAYPARADMEAHHA